MPSWIVVKLPVPSCFMCQVAEFSSEQKLTRTNKRKKHLNFNETPYLSKDRFWWLMQEVIVLLCNTNTPPEADFFPPYEGGLISPQPLSSI